MSKSSRYREASAEKQRLKKEREEFEAKKVRVRKVTAIVTVTVILAIILVTLIGTIIYNVRMNGGEYLRTEIAASSQSIDIDGAMMNYYFNDVYNTFVDYYGSYVQYYGLDTTLPLKSQTFSDGESWFDYFMSGAKQTVSNILMLNEAASAAGVTLTDAERAAIANRAEYTDEGLYGRGVRSSDIESAKLLEALAYKYQFMKEKEFTPTADEIDRYFNESPECFMTVDYYSFPLYYSDTGMSEDEVRNWADKLKDAQSTDEFEKIVREVLLCEDPDMADNDIAAQINGLTSAGVFYTEGNAVSEWAFKAMVGETLVVPDAENTTYTVYMLTVPPRRSDAGTVSVRHILLSDETYGSREKALKAAEKVLAAYESGERTEESFAILALEHSDDAGSYYNGGLYQNIKKGTMLASFNDWCFAASRKVGEHGVIETDLGCHIMYFVGDGPAEWQASVSDAIVSERIDAFMDELADVHPVAFDDTVLTMIPD